MISPPALHGNGEYVKYAITASDFSPYDLAPLNAHSTLANNILLLNGIYESLAVRNITENTYNIINYLDSPCKCANEWTRAYPHVPQPHDACHKQPFTPRAVANLPAK